MTPKAITCPDCGQVFFYQQGGSNARQHLCTPCARARIKASKLRYDRSKRRGVPLHNEKPKKVLENNEFAITTTQYLVGLSYLAGTMGADTRTPPARHKWREYRSDLNAFRSERWDGDNYKVPVIHKGETVAEYRQRKGL